MTRWKRWIESSAAEAQAGRNARAGRSKPSDLDAIRATIDHLRHAMDHADLEDRRGIIREAVRVVVVHEDRIDAELTCDASAGQRSHAGNPAAPDVRHGIPLSVPIVPARPQTYRPARRTA